MRADYLFRAAGNSASLLTKYPGCAIIGNFSDGRWPAYADRGGASMELRDASADNAQPEAWAASSTLALGAWQTIT